MRLKIHSRAKSMWYTKKAEVRAEPIRTFLCAEIRNEKLWVFLPPQVNTLDEFITLVGLAERIATDLSLVLHLEGYEPPKDGRLGFFRITPDPGVIEMNFFPSGSMKEAAAKTQVIYDEAEKLGLTTDRYMLDGRPSATGGGNSIYRGAMNPADSPFLRRADLLASLVAYWQNHPALSYCSAVCSSGRRRRLRVSMKRAMRIFTRQKSH